MESSGFLGAMSFRLEAHNEVLAIIRPFFSEGWTKIPPILQKGGRAIVRRAAVALRRLDQLEDAFAVAEADSIRLFRSGNPSLILSHRQFLELASTAGDQYKFALEDRLIGFASDCASISAEFDAVFSVKLAKFRQLSNSGSGAKLMPC